MTIPTPLFAGIDGGQTSTRAIITTTDGTVLGTGTGPACDHLNTPGGLERNRAAIHDALRAAAQTAGASLDRIIAIGLGLTSAQRELDPVPRIEAIVREIVDPATIWVDTDFASNLAGASGGSPGIVVIAGGGSIGYGIDEDGNEAIAGGLGYLMGDEGSGWFLGIEGLQAAARAEDQRGAPTQLVDAVRDHYGIDSIREILRVIYRADFIRSEVSALAPRVIELAERHDAVAREIVDRGVAGLIAIALGVARQLHEQGAPVDIYPTGGIFSARSMVFTPFAAGIEAAWAGATVREPRFSPACGALIRAAQAHGTSVDENLLDRIASTLPST